MDANRMYACNQQLCLLFSVWTEQGYEGMEADPHVTSTSRHAGEIEARPQPGCHLYSKHCGILASA